MLMGFYIEVLLGDTLWYMVSAALAVSFRMYRVKVGLCSLGTICRCALTELDAHSSACAVVGNLRSPLYACSSFSA